MSSRQLLWEEVSDLLNELDWYASRKVNLAQALVADPSHSLGDLLAEELADLRCTLRKIRDT